MDYKIGQKLLNKQVQNCILVKTTVFWYVRTQFQNQVLSLTNQAHSGQYNLSLYLIFQIWKAVKY